MSGERKPAAAQSLRLEMLESVSPELFEAALAPLKAFNRDANPIWYAARDLPENAPRPLNLLAFNAAGQVIAGLFGSTQLSWLKVNLLSVLADQRRHGLGTWLMQQAEALGIERGCRHAYVDTMEYQAPAFYERLGYVLSGRFPDWDSHGHAKLFYIKQLTSSSSL